LGEQLLFRLKHQAFSLFDVSNKALGCPHEACKHAVDVDLHHVFWEFPAARALRRHMLLPWRRLGIRDARLKTAMFGLTLNEVPDGVWRVADEMRPASLGLHTQLVETVSELTEASWRIGVALYLQAVWRWRVNHFDPLNNVTTGHHTATLTTKLRHGYAAVSAHMKMPLPAALEKIATEILQKALAQGSSVHNIRLPLSHAHTYVLFYGGRTSGKHESAGSGAVILRAGPAREGTAVCWVGQMFYASSKTTIHTADNLGLLSGLTECARKSYGLLHIIGDSTLSVEQHRRRKPPKVPHLKEIYWRCRRLTERLTIIGWHHQQRSSNMMVTKLAHAAMKTKYSKQQQLKNIPERRHDWEPVLRHMDEAMAPWIEKMANTAHGDAVADCR
jgi:ribonuclease HI